MRQAFTMALMCAVPALAADAEVFHGWSKDGTWFVKEAHGLNDVVELYFCASETGATPTWPATLNEADRLEGQFSCVRLIDANKAPYQWKKQLVLPEPSMAANGLSVSAELITDGETPGYVVDGGAKKQTCYAQGLNDGSKLQKVWWHPNGKKVAAQIDGVVTPCGLTVKAVPVKNAGKPGKKK